MSSANANALAHSSLLRLHCSMPRPPNRSRRKPRRTTFSKPAPSSSSSSSSSFSVPDFSDSKIHAVIDFDHLYYSSKFNHFIASAKDAYADLQTLITFDHDRRLVVSCRPSTLRFAGNLVVLGCAVVLGFRVFVGLLRFASGRRFGSGRNAPVVRRDRSLGGKEVVVGTRGEFDSSGRKGFGGLSNPLEPAKEGLNGRSERVLRNWVRVGKRLPKWWPKLEQNRDSMVDKQDYQREANRLIRAITDNRLSGKDIVEHDIIQLRQICRTSGVRVSFDTTNTRDSFYRTSVDYVLNVCGRAPSHSSIIQIDGEDVRLFVAGLAENIGLENTRAGRIVSAAVAARTRSRFLQAWALEMQGKHDETMSELSKICLLLRIFPPDELSPEMEMVARGLEKHLKVEQREFLMNMLVGFCDEESRRSAAEALGLMPFPTSAGDQQ
ncbi:phosphoribosylformylglycinamidine synthase [Trema orientale]|uniref:Phosphoribosylformylglycinamidine synthase n=1 Tax=Trema orientale TaxID=63057 RepID=A0A2P5G014_TREOI|nr:phosphoribosylformylglycinamidine synthase [Trema orientale]